VRETVQCKTTPTTAAAEEAPAAPDKTPTTAVTLDSTRRRAPRALYEYALDDFEESGILKEHVTGTDGNYGRIAIRTGKLYSCSSAVSSEWLKILAAAKTLPQEILDLGDMVWGHSMLDQAMTTERKPKNFSLRRAATLKCGTLLVLTMTL